MNVCIVCDSTYHKTRYQGILQCERCGHVFADIDLGNEELFEIYKKSYFFGDEYSDYLADKAVIQKNFQRRIKALKRFLDPHRHCNLLEIGSAYGFFLEIAQHHFHRVRGIDITEDGVRYASEKLHLETAQADFLTYDLGTWNYDVACMWDTIEHLSNPQLYIERISDQISRGGLIAITTGDIESFNARIQGQKWRLIHPPTHLHYFSMRTLTQLLRRYGFSVVYRRYCGFYRSIDNVFYNLFVLRQEKPDWYNIAKKLGVTKFDFYLNMYDIMYIIAKKD